MLVNWKSTHLTADGQVTAAGEPGKLIAAVLHADGGPVEVQFENGSGGNTLLSMAADTGTVESVVLGEGAALAFDADIYANLTIGAGTGRLTVIFEGTPA